MIFSDQILQKECSPVEHQRKHTNNTTDLFMLYQLKVYKLDLNIIWKKGGGLDC